MSLRYLYWSSESAIYKCEITQHPGKSHITLLERKDGIQNIQGYIFII